MAPPLDRSIQSHGSYTLDRPSNPLGRPPQRGTRRDVNDTRQRLVQASAALLQRQGLPGTGIKQILADAGAPYSSLYHHFPGGKDELAAAAIRASGPPTRRWSKGCGTRPLT